MTTMQDDRAQLDRLLDLVAELDDRGEAAAAAAWAQVAGEWAWFHHCGGHVLPGLEARLVDLGRRCVPSAPAGVTPLEGGVLVVMTESGAFGHTRHVERVLRSGAGLPGRASTPWSVAMTLRPWIPDWLGDAVGGAGGCVVDVSAAGTDLLTRAAALRTLAAGADAVVLATHPFDALPLLALADLDVPVGAFDHVDHGFWLGLTVTRVVAGFRAIGNRVARERRGLPDERVCLVPLEQRPHAPARARAEVRASLGVPAGAVLGLVVGHGTKYGDDFFAMVGPALDACPDLHLVAAGPEPVGAWADLTARTSGRALALGERSDVPDLLAAADLYVNTFPVSGGNAVLEAAAAGLPVVALDPPDGMIGRVLRCVSDPVWDHLELVPTAEDGAARLRELAADADRRTTSGARLRAAVEATNGPAAFRAAAEAFLARLLAASPTGGVLAPVPPPDPDLDEALRDWYIGSGQAQPLAGHTERHLPLVDPALAGRIAAPASARGLLGAHDDAALSVVVLCQDDAPGLVARLGEVLDEAATLGRLDVTLVDLGSTGEARGVLAALGADLRVLCFPAGHPVADAWTAGLDQATSARCLVLSTDTPLAPGTLAGLAEVLAADPGADLAGPGWDPSRVGGACALARPDRLRRWGAAARPARSLAPA